VTGWFGRLKAGLARSSGRLTERLGGLFTGKKIDAQTLQALEDALIAADLGPATAAKVARAFGKTRLDAELDEAGARAALAEEIAAVLEPAAGTLAIDARKKPHVVLVVGVNGTGKTTTIGKLAKQLADDGKSVMMCAGDTFRAAAIDQLKVWGERAKAVVVAREPGANAAGLVYDALAQARAEAKDVLLIDTAGRLHNKADLMAELEKIIRVIRKLDPEAPHTTLLVLDATTGQNAHAQVELFQKAAPVNGLVVTKLDGSAKGGVIVALADRFKIPVIAVGVGEGIEDLRPFAPRDFARGLLGLEA
jgi:fused signal recognition particle receptor